MEALPTLGVEDPGLGASVGRAPDAELGTTMASRATEMRSPADGWDVHLAEVVRAAAWSRRLVGRVPIAETTTALLPASRVATVSGRRHIASTSLTDEP